MSLRDVLDSVEPHFVEGGRFEKLFPVYEMVDTIFYSPGYVTRSSSHVRDQIDMKRVMSTVWIAAFLPMFAGMYYTGLQANLAMDQTRTSIEMAREVGEHAQKVMVDAMLPEKKAEA